MTNAWDLSIRRCAPGDERRLSLVAQAAFLEAFAGTLPAPDLLAHCERQHSVEKYAAYLRDPASVVWIAEVAPGGAPVGYLVLTTPDLPLPDLTSRDAEVKRVYLLNRFQGAGIGRQLMRTAEAHAKTESRRRLLLGVYSGNADAIAFYEKLGYRKVGTRRFNVGDNTYDDLVMALSL